MEVPKNIHRRRRWFRDSVFDHRGVLAEIGIPIRSKCGEKKKRKKRKKKLGEKEI